MKVVCIIQARRGSTRLKNKMLLPLAGAPLIQRVLERVKRATRLDYIVLAYPHADHDAFFPFVYQDDHLGYYADTGDASDLVGRYLSAAKLYNADLIVRIPGDNPCVEPEYIDKAVNAWLENELSCYSNTTAMVENGNGAWAYVDGIGAEVFSMSRLKWLDLKTRGTTSFREHPHAAFMYELPHADLRLDVNTQADYDFIADIYQALWPTNHHFTITDILAYLERKKVTA